MKILIVVTSTARYARSEKRTGLWLSECTHIYDRARAMGYDLTLASPQGGDTPVDPMSLRPILLDYLSRKYWNDADFRKVLGNTHSLDEAAGQLFDCIYLAGGHGAMFDFAGNPALQSLLRRHFESGRIVAAICRGVCGLLDVDLSDGTRLIADRHLTGYSWFEELLARRREVVPYDLEAALKRQDARYRKAVIPMTSQVVEDGNLITGQNPFSSRRMAEAVVGRLEEQHKPKGR